MTDHGIDRYEAQTIARDEARAVADELRRDLDYGAIAELRRDMEAVRRDIVRLREGLRTLDAMRLEG